jgi:hypothetical protein
MREKGIIIKEKEVHLQDEYNTDEEQLERDIGWCTQATREKNEQLSKRR